MQVGRGRLAPSIPEGAGQASTEHVKLLCKLLDAAEKESGLAWQEVEKLSKENLSLKRSLAQMKSLCKCTSASDDGHEEDEEKMDVEKDDGPSRPRKKQRHKGPSGSKKKCTAVGKRPIIDV